MTTHIDSYSDSSKDSAKDSFPFRGMHERERRPSAGYLSRGGMKKGMNREFDIEKAKDHSKYGW